MLAGLPHLFRFLLILIIVYYVFKLLVRFVFPFFLKNFVEKAQRKFYEQNPHLDPEAKKREGEVRVEHNPEKSASSKGKPDDDFGEYVDYEEVKD